MKIEGLTDLQKYLLNSSKQADKAIPSVLRSVGTKAKNRVKKRALSEVKEVTGDYHEKWKRGKVFIGNDGFHTVRVFNSSNHAHLLEDGHNIVNRKGEVVGFYKGRKIMKRAMSEFETSGQQEKAVSRAIDNLLRKNKL